MTEQCGRADLHREPRPPRPPGIVHILAIEEEAFVETADAFPHGPWNEQARPGSPGSFQGARVVLLRMLRRKLQCFDQRPPFMPLSLTEQMRNTFGMKETVRVGSEIIIGSCCKRLLHESVLRARKAEILIGM